MNGVSRFFHPRRMLRSRGFGVHSPFAFRFICMVIGERRCAYYAYGRVAECARRAGIRESDLKLLFRLVCEFRPATYAVVGRGCEAAAEVMRLASRRSARVDDMHRADLVWIGSDEACLEQQLDSLLACERVVVCLYRCPSLIKYLADHSAGMFFHSADKGIVVVRPHLPRQSYSIIF